MTPEAQRIAIAEACGWQRLLGDPWKSMDVVAFMPPGWAISRFIARGEPAMYLEDLPDYLRDLNAMHEAEKACIYSNHATYVRFENILIELVGQPLHATAAQRARAFLETLGLWDNGSA